MDTSSFLYKMLQEKKQEIEQRKSNLPLSQMIKLLEANRLDVYSTLKRPELSFITELKRSSPSKGSINVGVNIEKHISLYNPFARMISVLTEENHFGGSLSDISSIRQKSPLPLLRKDFIIDPYQIYESLYYGSNTLLLIVAMLDQEMLCQLIEECRVIGIQPVVEIHTVEELNRIRPLSPKIVLINNRNLHTLQMHKERVLELSPKVDWDAVIIAASGYETREDVLSLDKKVDAVLIGTSLMQSEDPEKLLFDLTSRPLIKVCGITNSVNARMALHFGADFLGFIFYPKSPRCIAQEKAKQLLNDLPIPAKAVGVFVDESLSTIIQTARELNLFAVQLSGDETVEYCQRLKSALDVKIIKKISIHQTIDIDPALPSAVDYFLLEPFDPVKKGGTGHRFSWELIDGIPEEIKQRTIIAGGITPENISQLKNKKIFALDLNSGYEISPGIKSFQKLKTLSL